MNKNKKSLTVLLSSLLLLSGCQLTTSSSTSNHANTSTPSSTTKVETTSSTTSVDTALEEAKKEARDYIASIDLTLYREEERNDIQAMIDSVEALLESEDVTVERINSALASLKTYVASKKTDAEYKEEEKAEEARLLEEAKEAKKAEVDAYNVGEFRKEEQAAIVEAKDAVIAEIDACENIEAVNAITTDSIDNVINSSKTNASYIMDEMVKYPNPSKWPLVNEHAYTWTRTQNGILTNQVGYLLSQNAEYGDMSFTFTVNSTNGIEQAGIIKATQNATYDGIDGYLINLVNTNGNQFVQIYYMYNAYASGSTGILEYIGGWVFPGLVAGTTFRIEFAGNQLNIYNDAEYRELGSAATTIAVDLTVGGKYETYASGKLGMLNWQGCDIDMTFNSVVGKEVTVGKDEAKELVNNYVATIDLEKYRDAEKAIINEKTTALTNEMASETSTYASIIALLDSSKEVINELKTDADYKLEEGENFASAIMDSIMNTPTQSAWDLVREHTATWTLKDADTINTNSIGWQFNSDVRAKNFDMVFSFSSDVEYWDTGILVRGGMSSVGNGIDGYLIGLVNRGTEQYVQVFYLNNAYGNDNTPAACEYIHGWVFPGKVTNQEFRIRFEDNYCHIYLNSDFLNGNTTPAVTVDLSGKPVVHGAGLVGLVNWYGASVDVNLHSFIER